MSRLTTLIADLLKQHTGDNVNHNDIQAWIDENEREVDFACREFSQSVRNKELAKQHQKWLEKKAEEQRKFQDENPHLCFCKNSEYDHNSQPITDGSKDRFGRKTFACLTCGKEKYEFIPLMA